MVLLQWEMIQRQCFQVLQAGNGNENGEQERRIQQWVKGIVKCKAALIKANETDTL